MAVNGQRAGGLPERQPTALPRQQSVDPHDIGMTLKLIRRDL